MLDHGLQRPRSSTTETDFPANKDCVTAGKSGKASLAQLMAGSDKASIKRQDLFIASPVRVMVGAGYP